MRETDEYAWTQDQDERLIATGAAPPGIPAEAAAARLAWLEQHKSGFVQFIRKFGAGATDEQVMGYLFGDEAD